MSLLLLVLAAFVGVGRFSCTWTDFQLVRNRLHPVGLFRDTFRFGLRLGRIYRARKVTALLTTSTLIFLSGVFELPISLATILVWIQASSSVSPIVSLFSLARARSARASSSEYFGVGVAVAAGQLTPRVRRTGIRIGV